MGSLRQIILATTVAAGVALAMVGSAAATTSQMTVPFSDVVDNPCNGDVVAITGTMHIVTIENDNKAEIQVNWPDTSGVSLTGTKYQANDTTHTYVFSTGPNAFIFTFHDSYELISQDNTSNFLVHEEVRINLLTSETTLHGGGVECSGPTPAP